MNLLADETAESKKIVSSLSRKPHWLKVKAFGGIGYKRVNRLLTDYELDTVCRAANCPNRGECFERGTATFLILGPTCTRNCRFCDIPGGTPAPVRAEEPSRLAAMAAELGLRHVVVTSVTRDDLPDGGAGQFAETVRQIRGRLPEATVELLTPDFDKAADAADIIISCRPDVFNHNIETVPRLYQSVRPQADYHRSLQLLSYIHDHSKIITKSGLMVGLGETTEELEYVFSDLAENNVSILTIGQYLSPSRNHVPVVRYLSPDEFELLGQQAERAGIRQVLSAPLVRSSYRADMFSLL
ncbi:MAG: lipoyl synthase [candidate division Zixibacteria bacterium]|nr:lipoyl synthase [candidate division Zixibacteria bacterium]